MRYRRLGRSSTEVSEIGFSGWTIALNWWGREIDDDEAGRMLARAHDLGITLFETGDMYGKGRSEALMGIAFEGARDDIVLSTKYGYDFADAEQIGHAELPQRFDPAFTRAALRASLERLRTERVDIYGLHNPKMHHIRDDSVFCTMGELVSEGMVGACQVALGPAIGWTEEGIEAMGRPEVNVIQTVYNILEQTPGNELLAEATRRDVGVFARVPDASGILTGKVTAETKIDEKDHRSVRKGEWIRASLEKVEQLRPIAERNGLSITELAIKFILSKEGISSVIPTVTSVEEIEAFAAISDGRYVGRSDMEEVAALYEGWPPYELKSTAQR